MKYLLTTVLIIFLMIPFTRPVLAAATPVDYQLPYPGILPDNPFYILKAIRDKISGILISDPLKKTDFDISLADIRISAARGLVEQKNNLNLAESTISKAENYFEEAMSLTREAKTQGMDITEILKKLSLANSKHQEVITEIEKKLNPKDAHKFDLVKKRAQSLGKEIKKLN